MPVLTEEIVELKPSRQADMETLKSSEEFQAAGTADGDAKYDESAGDSHSDIASVSSKSSTASASRVNHISEQHDSQDPSTCGIEDSESSGVSKPLAEFDVLRFRNCFLEVVEELRMRREIDAENEEHIKKLVTEKHELEQKLEEERGRCASVAEERVRQEQELRRQFEDQMKLIEDEKAKHSLSHESREHELKALKDEIRALHLSKYNLEKKVQDQERKLQVQNSSRESYLSQTSQLEQRCSTVFKQMAEVTEQMEKLEGNVKGALDLNRKLQYVNEHQQCTLRAHKQDLDSCRRELVGARVQLDGREWRGVREEEEGARAKATEHKLRMQTELNRQLQHQLVGLREEHQGIIQQLQNAHTLVERHVESSAKLSASEVVMQEEVGDLRGRMEGLEERLKSALEQCQSLEEKGASQRKNWEEKCLDLERRLRTLQTDYSAVQESHDKLEEAKQSAARELDAQTENRRNTEEELRVRMKQVQEEVEKLREISGEKEEEWTERLRKLEGALEQSEALLQEKDIALQDNAKELADLQAKLFMKHLQFPTIITTASSITDGQQQAAMVESQPPSNPVFLIDSTPAISKEEKHPYSSRTSNSICVPSPPNSPVLSPEMICGSQQAATLESSPQIIEEPMDTSISTAKYLSPRIHLQRVQFPVVQQREDSDPVNSSKMEPSEEKTAASKEELQDEGKGESKTDLEPKSQSLINSSLPTSDDNRRPPAKRSAAESSPGASMCEEHGEESPSKKAKTDATASGSQTELQEKLTSCILPGNTHNGCAPASTNQTRPLGDTRAPNLTASKTGGVALQDNPNHSSSVKGETSLVAETQAASDKKAEAQIMAQPMLGPTATKLGSPAPKLGSPAPKLGSSAPTKLPWKLELPSRKPFTRSMRRTEGQSTQTTTEDQQKQNTAPSFGSKTEVLSRNTTTKTAATWEQQHNQPSGSDAGKIDCGKLQQATPSELAPKIIGSLSTLVVQCSTGTRKATSEESTPSHTSSAVALHQVMAATPSKEPSIVFSEDEEEEVRMMSSQMTKKIDRVQLFLKMDRLRKPKLPKGGALH